MFDITVSDVFSMSLWLLCYSKSHFLIDALFEDLLFRINSYSYSHNISSKPLHLQTAWKIFFCCWVLFFKSLSSYKFFIFSTITAIAMRDICFYFLSDLPQFFRYLRHLALKIKAKLLNFKRTSSTHTKNKANKN